MSQVDSVTLGEEASVVADCDAVLYVSAKGVVWSNALAASDASTLMLKLTVDMGHIRRLRTRSRVALMSLAGPRALQVVLEAKTQNLIFGIICAGRVKVIPAPRINFLGVSVNIVKTQNFDFWNSTNRKRKSNSNFPH